MDAILRTALKNKVAMELNAYPDRLDLNDVHLRMARERGVKIVINTDAHHTSHFEKIKYGGPASAKSVADSFRCFEYIA